MDEHEFHRVLELFPIIRARDFHFDSDALSQSSSHTTQNVEVKELQDIGRGSRDIGIQGHQDAFWNKLKAAAEKKTNLLKSKVFSHTMSPLITNCQLALQIITEVGATDAERFCKSFKQVYEKLVYEELSLDAAQTLMNLTIS